MLAAPLLLLTHACSDSGCVRVCHSIALRFRKLQGRRKGAKFKSGPQTKFENPRSQAWVRELVYCSRVVCHEAANVCLRCALNLQLFGLSERWDPSE